MLNCIFCSLKADRYVHLRELQVVSLESFSNLEQRTFNQYFLNGCSTMIYRGLQFREHSADFCCFCSVLFAQLFINFAESYLNC